MSKDWLLILGGFSMGVVFTVVLALSFTVFRSLQVGQLKRELANIQKCVSYLTQQELCTVLERINKDEENEENK